MWLLNFKKNFRLSPFAFRLSQGFTLLETLVAIFIIIVALAGVFGLVARLTFTATLSSAQLTAAYLAQEGIEIVRNIRDTNYLMGTAWDSNLPPGEFGADYTTQGFPDFDCNNKNLKFDSSFYGCTTDSDTKFKRKITIMPNGDILEVSVEVTWQHRGRDLKVTAKENLYKWLQ